MKNVKKQKKLIIFLYVDHTDIIPTKLIYQSLDFFKNLGITALAIENPQDVDPFAYITKQLEKAKKANTKRTKKRVLISEQIRLYVKIACGAAGCC